MAMVVQLTSSLLRWSWRVRFASDWSNRTAIVIWLAHVIKEAELVTVRVAIGVGFGGGVGVGVGFGVAPLLTTVVMSVALLLAAAGSLSGLLTVTVSVWG